ncbi:MAG: hypothetical protein Q8N56_00465 [bacterium]|nr:hypothetical protein [bacterium]
MTLFFLILLSIALLIFGLQKIKPRKKPTIKPSTALSKRPGSEKQAMVMLQKEPKAISIPKESAPPTVQPDEPFPGNGESSPGNQQSPPPNLPV